MNDKFKKALEYTKHHKKEIAIGAGLVILGAVTGGAIVHKKEFGSVSGTYKLLVGYDDKSTYDAYNEFMHAGVKILGGKMAMSVPATDNISEVATEMMKGIPDAQTYNLLIEAVGDDN